MCAKHESAQLGRTGSAAARDLVGERLEARLHRKSETHLLQKPAGGLVCSPCLCLTQPWAEQPV